VSTHELPDPASLPEAPEPRLSPWRVLIALVLVAAIAGGVYYGVHDATTTQPARAASAKAKGPWFAPYVDTTLTPTVAFQDRGANPARDVVLGFVVAGAKAPQRCTPTWGTYQTLDSAASALDLDRAVAQLRGVGGDAIVSFGGQANSELAVACDSLDQLESAYRSVVDRYAANTIDFDVEGAALDDTAANLRRAEAVRALQSDEQRHLAVWLTLPVTPQGMNDDALAVVRTTLDSGVELAGVNVMAMDYGKAYSGDGMRGAILSSVNAAHGQLAALYAQEGARLSSAQVWRRLGVTVMIGQNDDAGEAVSVADARAVAKFAASHGVGRVSMWSLNRDVQCGVTFAVVGTHSNVCSGVKQKPLAFSKTFDGLLSGTASGSASAGASPVTPPDLQPQATTANRVDDPATSPYPIWQPDVAYREGYKVVWHQAVYEARWYSSGQTPDSENVAPGDSAWRLIGPVLRTDRAPKIPTLPPGTYPKWTLTQVFRAGDRVLYHGLPYQANWYTQGDVPGGGGQGGAPSPWRPLYRIPGEPFSG